MGAVADHILRPVRLDGGESGWRDRIPEICASLRDALLSHTDGAELVSSSFAAGQSGTATAVVERLTDAARDAGVDDDDAELAARTVIYYVLGFTVDEQSRLQWDAAGALADEQSILIRDTNRQFAFGLQLLVDGLAAQKNLTADRASRHSAVDDGAHRRN